MGSEMCIRDRLAADLYRGELTTTFESTGQLLLKRVVLYRMRRKLMPFEESLPLVTKREIVSPLPPQRDVWQGDGDGNIIQSHILLKATTVTELLVHNVNTTSCASHHPKSRTFCISPEHGLNEIFVFQ